MDRQRIAELLSGDVARELLKRPLLRLAYTARDGTPRAIPLGYVWNGTEFIFCTTTNASKVAALQANPDVAFTIDTEAFPPQVLLVRGRADVEYVEGIPEEYFQGNVITAMTDEQRAGWEASVRELYDAMYRIRIVPTWVKVLDFETTLPSAVEELIREKQANSG